MQTQKLSRKDQKLSKKEAIFDAALRTFLEKGYEESRIIDIAEQAGIGKGTVYEYFSSKEELFLEMFHDKLKKYDSESEKIRKMKGTAAEKLKAYLELEFRELFYCHSGRKKRNITIDTIMGVDLIKNEKIARQIQGMIKKRLELLTELIEQGIASGEFPKQNTYVTALCSLGAVSACSFLDHRLQENHVLGSKYDFQETLQGLVNFVLRGISQDRSGESFAGGI